MRKILFFWAIILGAYSCIQSHKSESPTNVKVVRKGAVIMAKPEKLALYKKLHAHPWESVITKLKECNIHNYSIFYRNGYLFSYMEYTGTNWKQDMQKLAADSTIQAWWKLTDPCQEPVSFAKDGEWWADMEEIFHSD
ncbi:L-rhamnose mutarotase [Mariniphaga sediminis]|uniref:L-rhamnose mutarotase n=1 Tax=Mariniphaga sediminis TaxID=1628158 RepID=UPI0035628DC0